MAEIYYSVACHNTERTKEILIKDNTLATKNIIMFNDEDRTEEKYKITLALSRKSVCFSEMNRKYNTDQQVRGHQPPNKLDHIMDTPKSETHISEWKGIWNISSTTVQRQMWSCYSWVVAKRSDRQRTEVLMSTQCKVSHRQFVSHLLYHVWPMKQNKKHKNPILKV